MLWYTGLITFGLWVAFVHDIGILTATAISIALVMDFLLLPPLLMLLDKEKSGS